MSETGNGAEGARRPSASEAALAADLKPAGALECMMIQQMARAHDTTMACFDRAEEATESAAREVELRLAARFMALFMRQAVSLERRRARPAEAGETAEGEMAAALPPPTGAEEAPPNRHQRRAIAKRARKARKRQADAA